MEKDRKIADEAIREKLTHAPMDVKMAEDMKVLIREQCERSMNNCEALDVTLEESLQRKEAYETRLQKNINEEITDQFNSIDVSEVHSPLRVVR